jgi:biotin synthase
MKKKSWTYQSLNDLYHLPFTDLLCQAQAIHKENFKSAEIQLSTLLNIKTGACPEDCGYCTQSGHFAKSTGLSKEKLLPIETVISKAKLAKENGATRFCIGAAWRSPSPADLLKVAEIIYEIKELGLETCATLGMLDREQAQILKNAGLDYYNHNIDTSREFYPQVITTHTFQDRLDTIKHVTEVDMKVCCGGIMGLGETHEDRINFILELTNLAKPPESIPINRFVPMPGTPLENTAPLDNFIFIRIVALARIVFPRAYVRLSAGRFNMSEEMQALCFIAGANSIHFGEKLLTTRNQEACQDLKMLQKLGIKSQVLI